MTIPKYNEIMLPMLQNIVNQKSHSYENISEFLIKHFKLTDEDISKAVDYLRDTAEEAAKNKAERIYLEEFRKSLKAMIMKDHLEMSVSAQEREAYASDEYQKHLRAMQIAIEKDERQRFMRIAAEAKIEAWRSMSANYRSIKL